MRFGLDLFVQNLNETDYFKQFCALCVFFLSDKINRITFFQSQSEEVTFFRAK
jgi:hypothetical protein